MSKEEIDKLFQIFCSKYEEGYYTLPPMLIIYDIAISRYGEEYVDLVKGDINDSSTREPESVTSLINDIDFLFLHNIKKIDSFSKILDILLKYHPGDLGYMESKVLKEDFILKFVNHVFNGEEYHFSIVIKYDMINITNSNKDKHVIYDLYASISFSSFGKAISHLKGFRSSLSVQEVNSKYVHSHLPSLGHTGIRFNAFCLGNSDINNTIEIMSNMDFDVSNIYLFFNSLDILLGWESIEGTPYRYISNIIKGPDTVRPLLPRNFGRLDYFLTEIFQHNLNNDSNIQRGIAYLKEENIRYIFSKCTIVESVLIDRGYIRLLYNNEEELQKYVTKSIFDNIAELAEKDGSEIEDLISTIDTYTLEKNSLGECEFFTKRNADNEDIGIMNLNGRDIFKFRGNMVKFKIFSKEDQESLPNSVVHPYILYYIIKELELTINKLYAKRARVDLC